MSNITKGEKGHVYKFGCPKKTFSATITETTKAFVDDLGGWEGMEYLRIAVEHGFINPAEIKAAIRKAEDKVDSEFQQVESYEERQRKAQREYQRRRREAQKQKETPGQ